VWGVTTNFGSTNLAASLPGVFGGQSVSNTLTGLLPGTKYYYAITASNIGGTGAGIVLSFTTRTAGRDARRSARPSSTPPAGYFTNGAFRMQLWGDAGRTYVLQATTNFSSWLSISTNVPATNPFYLADPDATNFGYRFYRVVPEP
jgi:hypothetical protein